MTDKENGEKEVDKEIEMLEEQRRKKEQIGDEKGVAGAEIVEEMEKSFIDYAMSVIVDRALPSIEDGLKPVHRRILYAMHLLGLEPNKPTMKSARIVGETMGKFHPHGNLALYDSLVRMAQDFSLRYPLVHGQGNFGSLDGDNPAADRYTEAKLSKISGELLEDIDKETVKMQPNYDNSVEEPETWGTSGGAVRPDEDPFQSALRETIEEIGSIPSYRKVSEYIWQSGGNFKYTTYILEATDLNWEPKNFNWEVDDAKWISFDHASNMNLHFGLESLLNAKKQELENKMKQGQQLIGYKIVGWDGKRAFSLYQTNKTVDLTIGSIDKNIYLGTTRQFVLDYYSGGTDYQDLLLTYQFKPEDVIKGNPDDKGPGGGEIIVQQANLIKVETV